MNLSRVGVVGAGTMGSGVAQKLASEGATVVLVERDQQALDQGMLRIRRVLDEGAVRKVHTPAEVEAIIGRIEPTLDFAPLRDAGLVIEAVFEDLEVKREVFAALERTCGRTAILATNTSSFRVTDLQDGLTVPSRVVGLHFFYHPAKNRLVEVVAGEHTDPVVAVRAWTAMEVFGKTPITSGDAQGFIVNRFFVPWLNEAVRLLEEEHATTGQIDKVARDLLGVGTGPFALMNATGVSIALHAANTLGETFGPLYAPARLLERAVTRSEHWVLEAEPEPLDQDVKALVESRLCGAAWLAAAQLVEEGVGTVEDVDVGARVGLRWRHGPFELANRLGVRRAACDAEAIADAWDVDLPRMLAERLDETGHAHDFHVPTVRAEVDDGVGVLTFNRPDQLNALSPRLLFDLEAAWHQLEADEDVRGIVLRGAGKAFMAGADLKFFADALGREDVAAVRAFTEEAAALYNRIADCPKRVVALVDGLALGGGAELALCADAIVITDRGSLGFPETGLGIYPGLGGTQRTARRLGRPLARWLVLTGRPVACDEAHAIGLADVVASREEAMSAARKLVLAGDMSLHFTPRPGSSELRAAAERLLADGEVAGWLDGRRTPGDDADAQALARALERKAPLALQVAAELIDLADEGGDVALGLRAELEQLERVFSTRDARHGIEALLRRERPVFEGR